MPRTEAGKRLLDDDRHLSTCPRWSHATFTCTCGLASDIAAIEAEAVATERERCAERGHLTSDDLDRMKAEAVATERERWMPLLTAARAREQAEEALADAEAITGEIVTGERVRRISRLKTERAEAVLALRAALEADHATD